MLAVVSSNIMALGSIASALATATRWRSPPLRPAQLRFSKPRSPTASKCAETLSGMSAVSTLSGMENIRSAATVGSMRHDPAS
mmetsp:Transcript_9985/g.26626  ORF Transcript_9985/g.26626 Transcript_9985/m.26626 type:complete len:83 (-) Transcript_9985:483-731(-)